MNKTKKKPLTPLEKHSDEPVLKTNYKDPIKRYEMAERIIWSKLDNWKKQTIIRCKLTGLKYDGVDGNNGAKNGDWIFRDYARDIITLAEGTDEISRADSLPPVPAYTLDSEKAANSAQQS